MAHIAPFATHEAYAQRTLATAPAREQGESHDPTSKKTLVVAGLTAAASFGLVTPLTADASLSQCNANYMCAWGNNDFAWLIAEQYQGKNYWIRPFSGEENDETDSYANRSVTHTGCLAANSDGSGDRVTMPRGSTDNNLASWNSDEASSMRTIYGC